MDINNLKKGAYVVFKGKPHIVKEVELDNKNINLILEDIFTSELTETSLTDQMQEIDVTRRCATIIEKQKDELEIIDTANFKTIHAKISPELLNQASENDQVTYLQFGRTAKVIEVRKN